MDKKSQVWNIEAEVIKLYKKVCFDRPVTRKEAIELFKDFSYEDILDEEDIAVLKIRDATSV